MAKKLPTDAFDAYVALGPQRSYQEVARRFGVCKRTVLKRATREDWQRRIRDIEEAARVASTTETREAVDRRHRSQIQFVESCALKALRERPLRTAMDCVRSLALAIEGERELMGVDNDAPAAIDDYLPPYLEAVRARILKSFPGWQQSVLIATTLEKQSPGSLAQLEENIRRFKPIFLEQNPQASERDYANEDHGRDLLEAHSRDLDRKLNENS